MKIGRYGSEVDPGYQISLNPLELCKLINEMSKKRMPDPDDVPTFLFYTPIPLLTSRATYHRELQVLFAALLTKQTLRLFVVYLLDRELSLN